MAAKRKYPWEEWFGKHRTVIYRGRDYHCSQSMMWQQVRNAAIRYGVRARVQDKDDRIVIEVLSEIFYTDKTPVADESPPKLASDGKDEETPKASNPTLSGWEGDTPLAGAGSHY